jgi:hypothetical protein
MNIIASCNTDTTLRLAPRKRRDVWTWAGLVAGGLDLVLIWPVGSHHLQLIVLKYSQKLIVLKVNTLFAYTDACHWFCQHESFWARRCLKGMHRCMHLCDLDNHTLIGLKTIQKYLINGDKFRIFHTFRPRLVWMLKFNKHCSTFVLFDKKFQS